MKYTKVYMVMILVLMAFSLYNILSEHKTESIREGYETPVYPEILSGAVNSAEEVNTVPVVTFNGKVLECDCIYSRTLSDILIPESVLLSEMDILSSIREDRKIALVRGNHFVLLNPDKDEITVNGESAIIAGTSLKIGGEYYISGTLIAKYLGFLMNADTDALKFDFTLRSGEENYLPEKFSLKMTGRLPDIENQMNLGSCWVFSALSALESSLLPAERFNFTRDHMLLMNSSGILDNYSGEASMALAYLLSWQGPCVDPSDFYGDGVTDPTLKAVKHVQGAGFIKNSDRNKIKEAVYRYGGVEASMYLIMADEKNISYSSGYYNSKTYAYYYPKSVTVNHDIVIIGWDDNYSRNNFVNSALVPDNGAFICLNSWGNDFGDNGIFYVSYYDPSFAKNCMYFTDIEKTNNYSCIYQTDLCGMTANAGYGNETAYFANVYTAAENESLEAVGFYALGDNTSYSVYVMTDFTDEKSLKAAEEVKSGFFKNEGYYTVKLSEGVSLKKGEKFAVLVRINTPGCKYPVAIEKNTNLVKVDLTDGEGYLSSNGILYKRTEDDGECNVCLKAYTVRNSSER